MSQYLPQMKSTENKYQHSLGAIDRRVYKDEIPLSTDHCSDAQSTATGTSENRRSRFIHLPDTSSQGASSTVISNINTPVSTKSKSCDLSHMKDFYDWEIVDSNVLKAAVNFRKEIKPWNNHKKELKKKIYTINKGYLALRLNRLDDKNKIAEIAEIHRLFEQAFEECDPNYIVQAYSTSQDFSNLLNKDMARIVLHDIDQGCSKFSCDTLYTTEDGTKSIASLLYYHPEFITYEGKVYRGMFLSSELAHIQVNRCIMTTTFLSTSKLLAIADIFSAYNRTDQKFDRVEDGMISFGCTFIIKNIFENRRAVDISGISVHPYEEEVLLLPYSVFLITKRETIELPNKEAKRIEIEFEECDEKQLKTSVNRQ
jgi:hypothetical protein